MKTYVLYNQKANNGQGLEAAKQLDAIWKDKEMTYVNLLDFDSHADFFKTISPEDEVCLCGGDGTLNHFINGVDCDALQNPVYYFPTGSGNDFWTDIDKQPGDAPEQINQYITHLPTVTVKGKTSKFLNNVGFGIDGYCCEEGDRLKELSDKPINYGSIAVKGMLYRYKPTNAEVEVDGRKFAFRKAWLAPTMKGRFYGGGMMAAPHQNRLDPERKVTCMVMNGAGRVRTLIAFPSIFKGEHVKKKLVHVMKGEHVKVKFDSPVALQIDGETVLSVTEYEVKI